MSQGRSSLIDSGFDAIGTKGSAKAKGGSLDTMAMVKIGGGAVALILGVFLILRSMGVFSDAPTIPKMTATQIQQEETKREEERKQLEIETNGTVAGG